MWLKRKVQAKEIYMIYEEAACEKMQLYNIVFLQKEADCYIATTEVPNLNMLFKKAQKMLLKKFFILICLLLFVREKKDLSMHLPIDLYHCG